MPSTVNISAASAARAMNASSSARSPGWNIGEHVIRHSRRGSPRPTPSRSRANSVVSSWLDDRLETVVAASRPTRPCAQPAEGQRRLVYDDEKIRRSDVVVTHELPDRVATAIHIRKRLRDEKRVSRNSWPTLPDPDGASRERGASQSCRQTMKPTLCRVSRYSSPGLPNPTISFID